MQRSGRRNRESVLARAGVWRDAWPWAEVIISNLRLHANRLRDSDVNIPLGTSTAGARAHTHTSPHPKRADAARTARLHPIPLVAAQEWLRCIRIDSIVAWAGTTAPASARRENAQRTPRQRPTYTPASTSRSLAVAPPSLRARRHGGRGPSSTPPVHVEHPPPLYPPPPAVARRRLRNAVTVTAATHARVHSAGTPRPCPQRAHSTLAPPPPGVRARLASHPYAPGLHGRHIARCITFAFARTRKPRLLHARERGNHMAQHPRPSGAAPPPRAQRLERQNQKGARTALPFPSAPPSPRPRRSPGRASRLRARTTAARARRHDGVKDKKKRRPGAGRVRTVGEGISVYEDTRDG
ncbi:hypothetical protein DFH09DRAFT_1421752 [Mycena vulgaris]|nr:hypothetical protein DFH09DRAFT_1421752 [Mycena vulgaris]